MTLRTILVATNNQDKLTEIQLMLSDTDWVVVDLSKFDPYPPPEENGLTLADNALIKARAGFDKTGLMTISDDTGLEIDALGGAPGVQSARYAGENATYQSNLHKVLNELNSLPDAIRTARFRTVMALVGPDIDQCWEGICEGKITNKPIAENGFGYDPIFWSTDLGKTFSESSDAEKNSVSHRGKALEKLIAYLNSSVLEVISNV